MGLAELTEKSQPFRIDQPSAIHHFADAVDHESVISQWMKYQSFVQ